MGFLRFGELFTQALPPLEEKKRCYLTFRNKGLVNSCKCGDFVKFSICFSPVPRCSPKQSISSKQKHTEEGLFTVTFLHPHLHKTLANGPNFLNFMAFWHDVLFPSASFDILFLLFLKSMLTI